MVFITNILFSLAYVGVTLGKNYINVAYPGYQAYLSSKENKNDKMWLLYFLIVGLLSILEKTLLFPVVWV